MLLDNTNYHSQEANRHYMSASQLKRFLDCEALALAELDGSCRREDTTALLVGGYVDAAFSGRLDPFRAEHPEIYTNKGTLRAEYQQADDIIHVLQDDPLLSAMMQGEPQRIVTGEIAGVPFKCMPDFLLTAAQCEAIVERFPGMADTLLMAPGAIVDLKVMRDMEPVYRGGRGRLSFVEAWRYDLQMAVYQQLVGGKLPCFLVVATKEKTPDKALVHIPQYMMDAALTTIESYIPAFDALKRGEGEPGRCGRCEWCRSSKRITAPVDADELEGTGL